MKISIEEFLELVTKNCSKEERDIFIKIISNSLSRAKYGSSEIKHFDTTSNPQDYYTVLNSLARVKNDSGEIETCDLISEIQDYYQKENNKMNGNFR